MDITDALRYLRAWESFATANALHIATCTNCFINRSGERGVCGEGDKIWEALKLSEEQVLSALPDLEAAGYNVQECREFILRAPK